MIKIREIVYKLIVTSLYIVLLQQASSLFNGCSAIFLKCPVHQMQLQKIVGFRPPLEFLHARNLIYAPEQNFKTRYRRSHDNNSSSIGETTTKNTAILTADDDKTNDYDDETNNNAVVSMRCWRICHADNDCIAYVHLLDTDECFGYTYFERSQGRYVLIDGAEMPLVADSEAIYYEKSCLMVPSHCKNHLWALTKIPGSSLVFQGKKTIAMLVTRRDCAEKCLFENEFKCLSASFAPSYRNNRERFNAYAAQSNERVVLGRCILSDKDKMIQPDAFRAAPYDEEYIENQCYQRTIENDNCSYELYANSSFIYAEAKYRGLSQKECQAKCTHEKRFFCQGVSFSYVDDLRKSQCSLHSEDIISMGPRSLKVQEHSVYMRRVKCLDVQVSCSQDEMTIKYTPKDWFLGKMYASMHSKECLARGNGSRSTTLRLPIGTESKESRCGVLRAFEVTKDYQRIFISALIVIQNNANVQTQGDRLIKVGCIMSNSSWQANDDMSNPLTKNLDFRESAENVPSAKALESSVEFANRLPNEGSLLINVSDSLLLPRISLQIIDLSHEYKTKDVQIGQNLELQIIAEYPANLQDELPFYQLPPLPDFRATSLIAKTENQQNYVLLIDKNGCPTDPRVFPALERQRSTKQNILRARFHAFKFSGSSMVNFDVKIRFCEHRQCPPSNCLPAATNDQAPEVFSIMGRRRRQSSSLEQQQHFKVQNPVYISTVMDVVDRDAYLYNNVNSSRQPKFLPTNMTTPRDALPLNYNLNVRGPDMASGTNSFIYGERGVLLIAGVDSKLNLDTICLNQSLLIAIFIFWLIFQVALLFTCCYILQKYKRLSALEDERRKYQENLEYLEARRVHWADQGGYTL